MPLDEHGLKSRALLLLAVLLPPLTAFAVLFSQAFAAPYQDDYHAIISFAADYQQQPTFERKLLAIAAAQHNEYKLAFEHAVVATDLAFTHHLNFLFLAILGDLTLLPIAYLLWKIYKVPQSDLATRLAAFLPISLIFFGLTYWEALDWPMSGLQNSAIVMFSLAAIYFLVPFESGVRVRFVLACVAGALAAFTSANGFLLGPIGVLILIPRRAYTAALLWCASFVVPFAAYLYHYVHVAPGLRHPHYYFTRPAFFLAFVGGVIPSRWVAVVAGLLMLGVLVFAARSRFHRTNPAAAWFMVWVLSTAGLVAWVRGALSFSVSSRYSLYSVMIVVFCYAYLDRYLANRSSTMHRRFYASALVACVAFWVAGSIHASQKLADRRSMVLSGLTHYCADPAVNSPMVDPRILRIIPQEAAYEREELSEAIQRGLYSPGCNGPRQER